MTEDELQKRLDETLPAADRHGLFVEECQDQDVRLRFSREPASIWPVSALLSMVETSLRAAAGLETRLTHLNVTVLRPAEASDIVALARAIRRDGDVVHAEAWLFGHAAIDPMLHATASLSAR